MPSVQASLKVGCTVVIVLAAGCATPVKTDYKPGVNFSRYRTFAMLPLPQQATMDDPGMALRLAQPAREAVVSEMTAKGLAEAPANQAELAINLRGRSLPRVEATQYGYAYARWTRYGTVTVVRDPYVSVSSYTERTLVIEIFENQTKELVWVGSLTKETSSKPVTPQMLQEGIRKILAKYPPSP